MRKYTIENGDIVGYSKQFIRSTGMRPTVSEAGRTGVVTRVNIYPNEKRVFHKVLWDDETESQTIIENNITILEKGR